jgi:hypothetical protein
MYKKCIWKNNLKHLKKKLRRNPMKARILAVTVATSILFWGANVTSFAQDKPAKKEVKIEKKMDEKAAKKDTKKAKAEKKEMKNEAKAEKKEMKAEKTKAPKAKKVEKKEKVEKTEVK